MNQYLIATIRRLIPVKTGGFFTTEIILLCFGLLMLLFQKFVWAIPENHQLTMLFFLAFTVGVPHGALDFLVDEQNLAAAHRPFRMPKFLMIYLFRLLLFACLWYVPMLAFAVFFALSIFHFGETDLHPFLKSTQKSTHLYATYGILVFSLMLLTHIAEIATNVPAIGAFFQKNAALYNALIYYKYAIVSVFAIAFLGSIMIEKKRENLRSLGYAKIIILAILLVIVALLPMLLAFTFYFTLWHSITSVRNIFSYFKKYNNQSNFKILCGKSLIFSTLALASIAALYFGASYFMPNMNLLFALLVVLSVLTFPHLAVMHKMYENVAK